MTGAVRSLTPRGRSVLLLGVALVVAGTLWRYPVVAGLGVALVVLVGAEVVAVLGATGLRVARTVSPRVVVRHGRCEGVLRARGSRRRGLLRLDVSDLVDGTLVSVRLPEAARRVRAGMTRDQADASIVSVAYPVSTHRRGLIPVGPVQLRQYGLSGMASRSTTTGSVDEVRVLPRKVVLRGLPPGRRRAVQGGPEGQELGGTDLVGLHEYTMGDDLRRVHWASSARTGTLMVREDAEPSEPHLLVLLDDRVAAYTRSLGAAGETLFEEAVEVAAGVAALAAEQGRPVQLRTVSGRHGVDVPASTAGLLQPEAQRLDWVLAEIDLTADPVPAALDGRDLDIAVVVTGPDADVEHLAGLLDAAPTRVTVVLDTAPGVAVSHRVGTVHLRAADAVEAGALWDRVVAS